MRGRDANRARLNQKKPLEVNIMKTRTLIQAAIVAAVAAVPALSFAQQVDTQQAPKTRAEVRNELIQLERAGYNPADTNETNYPADIQAAEARVSQQNAMAQQQGTANTGYGPAMNGTTQSGGAATQLPGTSSEPTYGH